MSASITAAEIFLPVPGFDYYEVSNLGRVKSLRRVVPAPYNLTRVVNERMLNQIKRGGYLNVLLCEGGKRKSYGVHALVLRAHVRAPKKGEICCHNDGVRTNNTLDNLRWDTYKANSLDRIKHGTYGIKISLEDVNNIRELYATGTWKQREIGELFGIKQPQVSLIVNNIRWANIS